MLLVSTNSTYSWMTMTFCTLKWTVTSRVTIHVTLAQRVDCGENAYSELKRRAMHLSRGVCIARYMTRKSAVFGSTCRLRLASVGRVGGGLVLRVNVGERDEALSRRRTGGGGWGWGAPSVAYRAVRVEQRVRHVREGVERDARRVALERQAAHCRVLVGHFVDELEPIHVPVVSDVV